MISFIQDLILRMSDNSYQVGKKIIEGVYENEKTVSWAAYEEARQLNNSAFFSELSQIIETIENQGNKNNAYFILGYNAKNTKDVETTKYLVKRLSEEKDKAVLITMLDRLAELYKPSEIDTSQIYKLTENRNWQIRRSAFQALTNNEMQVENFLIDKLSTTNNIDDIESLLSSLMYIGMGKVIAHVEKHLKNRKPSIKSYTINVLAVIMLREKSTFEEIQKKLKISRDFVQTLFDKLDTLTRPG